MYHTVATLKVNLNPSDANGIQIIQKLLKTGQYYC